MSFIKKLLKLQKIEHEYHDENVFLKADRTLSKLNFLFNLKSKKNLVTLRKCVIHIICNIIKLI